MVKSKVGLMGNFAERVLKITKKIPKGKVATYSQVAKLTKNPRAYRAVGQTLSNKPTPITIPCHRVVKSDGTLGGYAFGIEKKSRLLKNEGIKIQDGKIDLVKYGWRRNLAS